MLKLSFELLVQSSCIFNEPFPINCPFLIRSFEFSLLIDSLLLENGIISLSAEPLFNIKNSIELSSMF